LQHNTLIVVSEKEIQNCFEGDKAKEILFDRIIEKDFILFLKGKGSLQYYPTFAKPFFKAKIEDGILIKGVEGSKTLRIIFNGEAEKSYNLFLKYLSEYNNRMR